MSQTQVPLLNARADGDLSAALVNLVGGRLNKRKEELCSRPLEREAYLGAISVILELRAIHDEMVKLYERNTRL